MLLLDLFVGIGRVRDLRDQFHEDRGDLRVFVCLEALHLSFLENAGEPQAFVELCDIGAERDPVDFMGFQSFLAGYDLAGALLAGEGHEIVVITKKGVFFVPAYGALRNIFSGAQVSANDEILSFLSPPVVILSDLIDFFIQFVQFFLIILILCSMRTSAGAFWEQPAAVNAKSRIKNGMIRGFL